MNIQNIIDKLTAKGDQHANRVYVGKGYTKADLLRDLREIQKNQSLKND